MSGSPSDKVVQLTLIVGILCFTALLLPADLQLACCSYERPQAAPPAGASPEAAVYEESASLADDLCSQWRWECKQLRSLLPLLLARVPVQGREGRHAASPPVLIPVRFFPRKLSPPAGPDDPFLG
jgi:hypothetical protein